VFVTYAESEHLEESCVYALCFLAFVGGPLPKALLPYRESVIKGMSMPQPYAFHILGKDLDWGTMENGFFVPLQPVRMSQLEYSYMPNSYFHNMSRQSIDGLVSVSGKGQNVLESVRPLITGNHGISCWNDDLNFIIGQDADSGKGFCVSVKHALREPFVMGVNGKSILFSTDSLPIFLKGYKFGKPQIDDNVIVFVETERIPSYASLCLADLKREWSLLSNGLIANVDGVDYIVPHFTSSTALVLQGADTQIVYQDKIFTALEKRDEEEGFYAVLLSHVPVVGVRSFLGMSDGDVRFFSLISPRSPSHHVPIWDKAEDDMIGPTVSDLEILLDSTSHFRAVISSPVVLLDLIAPPRIPSFEELDNIDACLTERTFEAVNMRLNVVSSASRAKKFEEWRCSGRLELDISKEEFLVMIKKHSYLDKAGRNYMRTKKFFSALLNLGIPFSYAGVYCLFRDLGCIMSGARVFWYNLGEVALELPESTPLVAYAAKRAVLRKPETDAEIEDYFRLLFSLVLRKQYEGVVSLLRFFDHKWVKELTQHFQYPLSDGGAYYHAVINSGQVSKGLILADLPFDGDVFSNLSHLDNLLTISRNIDVHNARELSLLDKITGFLCMIRDTQEMEGIGWFFSQSPIGCALVSKYVLDLLLCSTVMGIGFRWNVLKKFGRMKRIICYTGNPFKKAHFSKVASEISALLGPGVMPHNLFTLSIPSFYTG